MNSEEIVSLPVLILSDKELEEIEKLASFNYSLDNISLYFNIDIDVFKLEFEKPNSIIKKHFNRGLLMSKANVDKAILESAEAGNMSAVQIYKKTLSFNEISLLQNKILNGY